MRKSLLFTKILVTLICLLMVLPILNLDSNNLNDDMYSLSEQNPGGVSKILLDNPILLTPVSGAEFRDRTPYLDWALIVGAAIYRIEVNDENNFLNPLVSVLVNEHYYQCSTLSDNTYYWQVSAQDLFGTWSFSDVWHFTIDNQGPVPPVLVSPAQMDVINDDTPYLDWNPSSTAVEYRLQVDDSFLFSSPRLNVLTSGTGYTCPTIPSGSTSWYWRVSARDALGNWGSWSSSRSFTIDTTPPGAPTLLFPTNGLVIKNSRPSFSWLYVYSATQYNIELDDSASFSSPVISTTVSGTVFASQHLIDG